MFQKRKNASSFLFLVSISLLVTSCINGNPHQKYPKNLPDKRDESIGKIYDKDIVLWSDDGAGLINPKHAIGADENTKKQNEKAVIKTKDKPEEDRISRPVTKEEKIVNQYLWQAALNQLSSMPIVVADKKAGLITTDWCKVKNGHNERYKINVILRGTEFKLTNVEVKVFIESKDNKTGQWFATEASSKSKLSEQIHSEIINEARRLRYFSENNKKNTSLNRNEY